MITKSLQSNGGRINQDERNEQNREKYKGRNLRLVHAAVVENKAGVGKYQACLLGL